MITSFSVACYELSEEILDKTPEQIMVDAVDPSTRQFKLAELIKVYWTAKETSEELGFVGVGCISYAEAAMRDYQELHGAL